MSSKTSTVMVVKPDSSFLDNPVDLKKLLKALTKESAKAIEVLVRLLGSQDERIQLQAARGLIDMQVAVADKISTDQMQRLVAEMKLTRPQGQLVPLEGSQQRPLVDFGNIREIA